MFVRYSKHAKDRLKARGISKKDVHEALIHGQRRFIQADRTVKCEYSKSGKKLVIIYEQKKAKYKIITAYRP
jgi:hypothetical protein